MKKIAIVALAALGISLMPTVAFAEEVVEEPAPVVEETPVVPEQPAQPEYIPPAEASEGVGGWAVVDPVTGNVHGVIVGTMETFTSRNGVIGHEYMGCHANCVLRFQTRATADGNVAGWHGSDGSVKWNPAERTFTLSNPTRGGSMTQTLVPELTARDAAGMDLTTGIRNIRSVERTSADIEIRRTQDSYQDQDKDTDIVFPEWGIGGKLFRYTTEGLANSSITDDVRNELANEGYTEEIILEDGTTETVVDTDNEFVQTVLQWTESVVQFFTDLFEMREPE